MNQTVQEKSEHWCIAYKKKEEKEYRLVATPSWAWAADPFLVNFEGEIYLFAELFLYKSERNGVIGYCKWSGDGFSEWVVTMDKHWHLSYPNVFALDGNLYLVPETYQREDISLYVLKEFPNKWERIKTLADNDVCVDTTFFEYGGKKYMFTFRPTFVEFGGDLLLYSIDGAVNEEGARCILLGEVSSDRACSRPAGNLFYSESGKLIRPAQNCTDGYGCGISFMEVDSVAPTYKEHLVKTLFPDDVMVKEKPEGICFTGIHTYNSLDDIEVIDLKYLIHDEEEQEARRRIRKVFVNKYI